MNRRQLFAGFGAAALAAPALALGQPSKARLATCSAWGVDKSLARPWALSSTCDTILVAEHRVYVPGGHVDVPAGWITGLEQNTAYDVWYRPHEDEPGGMYWVEGGKRSTTGIAPLPPHWWYLGRVETLERPALVAAAIGGQTCWATTERAA